MPGVDLAGYNSPCRTVGGDYYDFLPYEDGRVAILVADVAGKGMPAAMLMSNLQARVQVLFDDPTDLAALITRLNRIIVKNCPSNRFISLFVGVYDTKTGDMAYCNAGHNPPLLVRANGTGGRARQHRRDSGHSAQREVRATNGAPRSGRRRGAVQRWRHRSLRAQLRRSVRGGAAWAKAAPKLRRASAQESVRESTTKADRLDGGGSAR